MGCFLLILLPDVDHLGVGKEMIWVQVQVCKTRAARSRGCAVNYLPVIAGGGGVCTITKVDTLMHTRMCIIAQCRGSYTTP